jgi:hypothetical protein
MKAKWEKIKDCNILMVWGCCNTIVEIPPTFYEKSGTPVCGICGKDMKYVETIIRR